MNKLKQNWIYFLIFSEFAIDIEYNFATNGHYEFCNAIAPKTQKHWRINEWTGQSKWGNVKGIGKCCDDDSIDAYQNNVQ